MILASHPPPEQILRGPNGKQLPTCSTYSNVLLDLTSDIRRFCSSVGAWIGKIAQEEKAKAARYSRYVCVFQAMVSCWTSVRCICHFTMWLARNRGHVVLHHMELAFYQLVSLKNMYCQGGPSMQSRTRHWGGWGQVSGRKKNFGPSKFLAIFGHRHHSELK